MWTKRELIEAAFGELALAHYVFDLDADTRESALRRLDTMMATWEGQGITLGYLMPASADDSNIDSASGIPDAANEAVYLNLALRLAPGRGKQISVDTRIAAQQGLVALMARAVMPSPQQLPGGVPLGAGNKPWRTGRTFTADPGSALSTGPGGSIEV